MSNAKLMMQQRSLAKVLIYRNNGMKIVEDVNAEFSQRTQAWGWVNAQLTRLFDNLDYTGTTDGIELLNSDDHLKGDQVEEFITAIGSLSNAHTSETDFNDALKIVKQQMTVLDAMLPASMVQKTDKQGYGRSGILTKPR